MIKTGQLIRVLLLFYRRLLFPALALSIGLSLLFFPGNLFTGTSIALLFFLPLFHYFIYEMIYPSEYYFYHNFGLEKYALWIVTALLSVFQLLLVWMIGAN